MTDIQALRSKLRRLKVAFSYGMIFYGVGGMILRQHFPQSR